MKVVLTRKLYSDRLQLAFIALEDCMHTAGGESDPQCYPAVTPRATATVDLGAHSHWYSGTNVLSTTNHVLVAVEAQDRENLWLGQS